VGVIQAIPRYRNPNTPARYLRSLELNAARPSLENVGKGRAQVIPFPNTKPPEAAASGGSGSMD